MLRMEICMPDAPYRLVNGTTKIQIEDVLGTHPGGGWVYQAPGTGNAGAEGAHYYYRSETKEGSHKTVPTEGRFAITLDMEQAGIYRLLLRVTRDTNNPSDARNDIWIQVDGDTNAVVPEGTSALTQGGEGFVKYKSSPTYKKWVDAKVFSTPVHGDANAPSDVVLGEGLHTVVFAPRSTGYHIDSLQVVTRSLMVSTRIATGEDDFEIAHGASNSDLDLGIVNDRANPVGMRFTGLDLPAEAAISSAYFVFTANADAAAGGSLAIEIQDTLDARDFVTGKYLKHRSYLEETVTWDGIGAWQKDESYRSADISDLIEALIADGGLDALDALAFRVSGTGTRSAYAFEDAGPAPELVINYL
jgi:hypothetical protein